jgi:hypothetical protein
MLIGLVALFLVVGLQLVPEVRAIFVYSCAVANSHSSLMEWAGQFPVSIIHHNICKHIFRNSVGSLTSCSG